ncbi:MAG: carboxymuconolactone decarboxylase family protein [Chloroflexi bacterium]|nr:carboxymuconolactone decarboxylase family protein [Chloroflexota bacterium]
MTRSLSEGNTTWKAKEILEEIKKTFGTVPNFFMAQAVVDPDWLELNWNREKAIMLSGGALDRKTKELIALAVSMVNRCEYCSSAHETIAMMLGATEQEIHELKKVIELIRQFQQNCRFVTCAL